MSKKTIAHFGTFDVDNYGDLLFPLIAEFRLSNFNWEHISLTNRSTIFEDAKEIISFENSQEHRYDAVLTGGGNIIHLLPNQNTVYRKFKGFGYADLWIGASRLAAVQKVPHIFNSPGIPLSFTGFVNKRLALQTFLSANYKSVRERYSKSLVKAVDKKNILQIVEVPDTAFDVANMWPIENDVKLPFMVVNLNPRYHEPIETTAENLDQISKNFNLPIKFIIIGACHGDLDFTYKVAHLLTVDYEITESKNLKNIAHLIGMAKCFFGSSMHGFITALSYGTPAYLVLNENPMHKFKGLLEMLEFGVDYIHPSFKNVLTNLNKKVELSQDCKARLNERLDEHWRIVKQIIELREPVRSSILIKNYSRLLKMNQIMSKILIKVSK